MKKLLDAEYKGLGMYEKTWLHTGDDGRDRITVDTYQDVAPIIKKVKETAQNSNLKDFRFVGSIPANLVNELSKELAATWGMRPHEAFRELMSSKSDRSKSVWKMLLKSRDYSKLQAKTYQ